MAKEKKNVELIIIALFVAVGGTLAYFIYTNNKNNSSAPVSTSTPVTTATPPVSTASSTPQSGTTTSPIIQYVGDTSVVAPPNYAAILANQPQGTPNNFFGAQVNYSDGGIEIADVPVEMLPSGMPVRFFIYAGPYPSRLSKQNIYDEISYPNTVNGLASHFSLSTGAIYAVAAGDDKVYPMSLDTAKAIGIQQDITDLLFVDQDFLNLFSAPIVYEGENGMYAVSPVNPAPDPAHFSNGMII